MNINAVLEKQSLRDDLAMNLMLSLAQNPSTEHFDGRLVHTAFELATDAVNRIECDFEVLKIKLKEPPAPAPESPAADLVAILEQILKGK